MALNTTPVWYLVDPVNQDNKFMNFVEPNISAAELLAIIDVGGRSITSLLAKVESALNAAGQEDYTITLNRVTRIVTITGTDTFELLVTTGTNSSQSIYSLIGFTADKTGAATYDSDTAIGTEYIPQFAIQDFTPFENFVSNVESSVNESAAGVFESVNFTPIQKMELKITNITDRFKGNGNPIVNNPNAVAQVREFLTFLITKQELEFMLDKSDRDTFETVLLEKLSGSRKGNEFRLKELISRGLNDFYETGKLTFRKVL